MSLVNDMLNDLEQRRSKEPARPLDLSWMSGSGTARPRTPKRPYLAAAVVVVSLLAVALAWSLRTQRAEPVAVQPIVSPSVPAPVAKEPTAGITAMNWIADGDVLRWQIAMTERKPYSISRDNDQLLVRFYGMSNQLDNATLLPKAPVQSLAMQQQGDDLVVRLQISGDFDYSDRLLKNSDSTVEVVIEPVRQIAAVAAVTPTEQPAAKPVAAPKPAANKPAKPVAASLTASPPTPTLSQQDLRTAREARKLLQQGDTPGAERLLDAFYSQHPRALRSGKLLASVWITQNRFDRAGDLLAALLAETPGDIELRILQARLLLLRNQAPAAVDWLMAATPPVAKHPEYYELLALAARRNHQFKLSEEAYRGLLQSDSNRGDWLVGLGIALDAQARTAEARDAYKQALGAAHLSQALMLYAQQRLSTAHQGGN